MRANIFSKHRRLTHTAIAAALSVGLGLASTGAMAQATSGSIFGQVPAASGETVHITNDSGFSRTVPVSSSGRYSITVPVGQYTVSLERNGETLQKRNNVTAIASRGVEVDFQGGAGANAGGVNNPENLASITVSASSLPAIDVTSTTENTTITAEQLQRLPLQRSASAIALLAPGTSPASGYFSGPLGGNLVSFGGSSAVENSYYINGFNTTDPLSGFGGLTLPYGSIEQQQTLTDGYGAKYGRADGGVISQIGKSGTNTFHFGGQILWRPAFARGEEGNYYYSNPRASNYGDIYDYRRDNNSWTTTYDAYVSGPLVRDKLFFFLSAEGEKNKQNAVQPIGVNKNYEETYHDPKIYAKINWNINDSNILEATGVKNEHAYHGTIYDYDYDTHKTGALSSYDEHTKTSFKMWSLHYTSYITDDLTLSALYGKMKGTYYSSIPGYDPATAPPHILGHTDQNPALTPGHPNGITNSNTLTNLDDPTHTSTNRNLRIDLEWRLGNHDLLFGIDNQRVNDVNDGVVMSGPGYAWNYYHTDPDTPAVGTDPAVTPYVGPPGGEGYYVSRYIYRTKSSARVEQRAQYIQDNWQVTPNLLLKLGLRNDSFKNYNPQGVPYLRLTKPQWAPRLGFSWDVFGDSSLKVFGNAGRYYLAEPASVALRAAGQSQYTERFFNYTSIDSQGIPHGLTPIPENPSGDGSLSDPGISKNREYGQPRNPKVAAATDIKSQYQDEYVLGMQQQINKDWVYGVTGTLRKLGRELDDYGDASVIYNKLLADGVDPSTIDKSDIPGSILFNPGVANTYKIPKVGGGYQSVTLTNADTGFPHMKRNYYSLDLYLQHPWDGKWSGKIDYIYARSYGNSVGPVRPDIGQVDVSATEDWDYQQIMVYSNGTLSNNRKHTLKAYGTYQVLPGWTVSGNLLIQSGAPRNCLGAYGPNETNPGLGYGVGNYHWCGGQPAPPGSGGNNPWRHILSLSTEYRPAFADRKLGFQIKVYNVFNEQNVTQTVTNYGTTKTPSPNYLRPVSMEPPRYVQFGVSYDF